MRPIARTSIQAFGAVVRLIGAVALAAACGGGGDGGTGPATVGSISLNPSAPTQIAAGSTLQLSASVFSTNSQPMSGQMVSFTSNAPDIATVSSGGQVTSVGPVGTSTITASVGSVHASVTVSVVAGPTASLTRTSADPGAVAPGATVGDSVRFVVKDAFGNPRARETINFSVSAGGGQASPPSAQTDAQGRAATMFITGATAGTNTLNATVSTLLPVTLSVTTAAGSITISAISPSPMTPGAAVTIDGAGFDPNPAGDAVTIDGQAATVTSASATLLVISVPTNLACKPAHQANVQVTALGASAIAKQNLRVGSLRSLAVGNSVVLTDPADVYCTELSPANAGYVVNVLNASASPTTVAPFRFVGATSIPPGTTFAPIPLMLHQSASAAPVRPRFTVGGAVPLIDPAAHYLELESNRLIYARMKNSFRRKSRTADALAPTSGAARALSATAVPAVGYTRTFRIRQFATTLNQTGTCSDYVEITARVVYVGTKAVLYEDTKAPLAGQMDSYFTRIGQEFDQSMYPSDATYFGDPLITDPDTDNDQHLNMVFTPSVPTGVGGFVNPCDFFLRNTTNNQSSNLGENFYARVATVAGTGFMSDTPDSWLRGMRATVVHEVKHIAAFGAHLENGASVFEESWLEEGMAMTAEEVWARDRIYPGATWKGNMLYGTTLYCDVRPTNTTSCNTPPFAMFDHFNNLYTNLDAPGTTSLFGRIKDNDFAFYYSAWSFIRYNADRYAASEVDFLRGITQAVNVTGLSNIARQANADPNTMLGGWSLSLYLDENAATAGNPEVNFPSWQLRDIYAGMNRDFPSFFPKTYPLVPQPVSSGDFTIDNAGIHGGSFSPFDLSAVSAATRTIGVSGTPSFRLVVARVQ